MSSSNAAKLRVAHLIGALVVGGAERFVVSLARELVNKDIDVVLICLSNRTDLTSRVGQEMLGQSGVKVHAGPTARVRGRTVLWLLSCLRAVRPDIVHLHTPNTELALFLACMLGAPTTIVVRTLHSTAVPTGWLFRHAWRRNRASVSIACSSAVKAAAASLPGRIDVIYNGVQFDWPMRTEETRAAARVKLGLDPKQRQFVVAGRLDGAYKGFDVLIKAWKAAALGDLARLDVLGDGSIRSKLEQLAGRDSRIVFRGMTADVPVWFTAGDCFVMPSLYEGLPLAAIEAAGTGIHCLFSDIPPLRELNAPSVTWMRAGSVTQLTEAVQNIAAQAPVFVESERVGQFRAAFSIAGAARKYARVYRSLSDKRH